MACLHPQRGTRTRHPGSDAGAHAGTQHGGGRSAGRPADLLNGGDHAVGGVAVGQRRDEQHRTLSWQVGAGLDGAGSVDRGLSRFVELGVQFSACALGVPVDP